MPIGIYALTLAAFAVGTAEFIVAGILPTLAGDLGVSIPVAGLLVTGYALGVAFGGPLLALSTAHLPRKAMIVAMVALFALGQVLCALAPNYPTLLVARLLVALTHGLFFGNASIVATEMVPPERRGGAIALVMAGVPAANLLGVPAGALLGHWLGWRATFWAIGALALIATVAIAFLLPRDLREEARPLPWRMQLKALLQHRVLLSYLAITVLLVGALAFGTYQVPFLTSITGIPEAATPPYLFAYGIGAVIGILLGGRLADWRLMPSVIGTLLALAAASGLILLTMHVPTAMLATMGALGAVGYAFSAPLQTRIIAAAAGAQTLAATFIATAFNIGYALGASTGAAVISTGLGYTSLPVAGIVSGVAAAAISLWSWRLDRV